MSENKKFDRKKFEEIFEADRNKAYGYLRSTELWGADLRHADLGEANLREANLGEANLRGANLWKACLMNADLGGACLQEANLVAANLSGVKGLVDPIVYLKENFEQTGEGYIVYKSFGEKYKTPERWCVLPGAVIEEIVNQCPTCECGCGINVGTYDWVLRNMRDKIYKLLIRWEWLPGVVVSYNTNGKIRCSKAQILGEVEDEPNKSI